MDMRRWVATGLLSLALAMGTAGCASSIDKGVVIGKAYHHEYTYTSTTSTGADNPSDDC